MKLDRVLILEDEIHVAAIIYETFKNDWRHVDHSDSVHGGVELIEKRGNHYDLILLDANLKDSSGLDTLDIVRAASGAPVVMHVGDFNLAKEIEERQDELGVYGILHKGSYEKYRINDVIEKAIYKWRDRRWDTGIEVIREEKTRFRREYLHG
jgi:DNA-binding NtrC family response regulator